MTHANGIRAISMTVFGVWLSVSVFRQDSAAGQAAVPLSRPGQEDVSFWINHNGLIQFDVEGEVGFGDMARVLLRRRSNGDYIRDLRDRGITVLITDHQVRETLEITDRSYVIRAGQVLCHGRPREVLNHPEARKYYFGEGMSEGFSGAA